jgi:hypothetical protein
MLKICSFFIETSISHTDAPGTVAAVNSTIFSPNPTSPAAIDGSRAAGNAKGLVKKVS